MYSFVRIEDEGSTFPITLLNNSRHMEVEIKSFIISKKMFPSIYKNRIINDNAKTHSLTQRY